MKFARSLKTFRGQLDVAPFLTVLFLVLMFVLMTGMIYTPGVRIQLPAASGLAGAASPGVAVAVDANGQLYFENQRIEETLLRARLRERAVASSEPPALILHADRAVKYDILLRLTLLAREAGLRETVLATLPGPIEPASVRATPP